MKITKFGHCCLLIEHNGTRILTDPGNYSEGQNEAQDIDIILITHEHEDHLHIASLEQVVKNNPQAMVVCNTAVAKLLDQAGITYTLINNGETKTWHDIPFEAFDAEHAEIYKTMPRVLNTGFFIGEKLFYPGDAFIEPGKPVDILALPVAGPWMKISEAIDYALAVKPRIAFPVHDGILKNPGIPHRAPGAVLPEHGITFEIIDVGATKEL